VYSSDVRCGLPSIVYSSAVRCGLPSIVYSSAVRCGLPSIVYSSAVQCITVKCPCATGLSVCTEWCVATFVFFYCRCPFAHRPFTNLFILTGLPINCSRFFFEFNCIVIANVLLLPLLFFVNYFPPLLFFCSDLQNVSEIDGVTVRPCYIHKIR
jgi:hypothetical protein